MASRKLGIAFIKGLNMFGKRNIGKSRLREILKRIERRYPQVKFLGVYGVHNDIVVFKKSGVHYATVGSWIEKELKIETSQKVHVTTRSLDVVKRVVERF